MTIGFFLGAGIISFALGIYIASAQKISIMVHIASVIFPIIAISAIMVYIYRRRISDIKNSHENELNKYKLYGNLLSTWMMIISKGKTLVEYFNDHHYKNIGIYGLDKLGICLYFELQKSDIEVKYAIDPKAKHFSYLNINVITPTDNFEPTDAIIVTNVEKFDKISAEIQNKGNYNVISLEDIIASI